jgi:hypothetical protein
MVCSLFALAMHHLFLCWLRNCGVIFDLFGKLDPMPTSFPEAPYSISAVAG